MSFEYTIFDADVGGVVNAQQFSDITQMLNEVHTDLNSYSCEEEYADACEIKEANQFDASQIFTMMKNTIMSPFFGEISVWLPGHHRKFKVEKKD